MRNETGPAPGTLPCRPGALAAESQCENAVTPTMGDDFTTLPDRPDRRPVGPPPAAHARPGEDQPTPGGPPGGGQRHPLPGRTGCQWRLLPKCFPPWSTVHTCTADGGPTAPSDRPRRPPAGLPASCRAG